MEKPDNNNYDYQKEIENEDAEYIAQMFYELSWYYDDEDIPRHIRVKMLPLS